MSNYSNEMQKGISFLNLIEKNKILIPKIQRDYAQGRLDPKASEIRDSFLTSIFDTLTSSISEPLLLDFIYGSTNNKDFTPLDGQQRLTTLFLLHWYFIPQNKKSLLFLADENSCYSKFFYETRISSKDFCNALVTYSCKDLKSLLIKENAAHREAQKQLSDIIKNQSWFLWSWRKDPTVKGMLIMLDEIDKRTAHFDESKSNMIWEQLENGKILFHKLPLEQFALTDELYVKMNARGKELSQFDILKSTLEEQMRLNDIREDIQNEWRKNVDSNWIDVFWNKLAKPHLTDAIKSEEALNLVNSVEKGYLRFFTRMMVFHLFLNDNCLSVNLKDENIKQFIPFDFDDSNFLDKIRDFSVRNDILLLLPLFNKTKFFNEDLFKFIIDFFKSFIYQINSIKHDGSELIEGVSFESKKTLFDSFIADSIDYETRVQFFALIKFFKFNSAQNVCENSDLMIEFNSWMRIIRNLSTNTNSYFYNGYDDFLKSLTSIETWANSIYSGKVNKNIIDYIKLQANLDGFNSEQLKEEKIKADLMSCNDWKDTIIKVEEHPYFMGQIRFLLEWSKVGDSLNISKFNEYYKKVCSVFDENGLKSELRENHIFRNSLMVISEWYLYNNCFMQDGGKDRDWSWKRYLRESEKSVNIKILLDKWDETNVFSMYCTKLVSGSKIIDWRKYFIEKPKIYDYLLHSNISVWNKDNEEFCLLSKTKWSSKHTELRVYYWSLKYKGVLYNESYNYGDPVSVKFSKDNSKIFLVEFIPVWDDDDEQWQNGYYLISCNFAPYNSDFVPCQDNKWTKKIEISQNNEVEKLIQQFLM